MKEKPQVKTAPEPVAGTDEVRQAIAALTDAESVKLLRAVERAAYRLRRRVFSVDHKEIFNEAISRVLDGRRHWQPRKVDFVGLLIGVIKSIEFEWREQVKRPENPVLESDLPDLNSDGDPIPNRLQQAADLRPGAERELIENEQITQEQLFEQLEEFFSDDALAALIFSEWRRGTKGPEIMKALDLDRQQFDTAVRRMDRAIKKHWPEGMPDVR
jgi:hypothetical protein